MKMSYDADTDTLRFGFGDEAIVEEHLGHGITVGYDGNHRITSIRLDDAMATSGGRDIFRQIVMDGVGPFSQSDPLIIVPRLFHGSELLDF